MGTVKYSGPVASFHCPTNAEIRSLKVHFSPKQLGEGDPSPENVRPIVGWDGVEVSQHGRNLYSKDNVIPHTADDEWNCIMGGVKQKIAVNSWPRWTFIAPTIPNATYYWTASCYDVGFLDKDKNVLTYKSAWSNTSIQAPANAAYVYHTWIKNESMSQEQLDAAFETYDLYCDISPTIFEEQNSKKINYEFGVLGKNKLNADAEQQAPDNTNMMPANKRIFTQNTYCAGMSWSNYYVPNNVTSYSVSNGTITVMNNNVYGLGYPVRVAPGQAYFLSATTTNGRAHIAYFASDGTYVSGVSTDTLNKSFTVPDGIDIAVIIFFSASGEATFSNVQLELGSSATTYEPYDPNKTVYGGWVDLITGEVCEEWGSKILDGTENWQLNTWSNNGVYIINREIGLDTSVIPFKGDEADKMFCNTLGSLNSTYFVRTDKSFTIQGADSLPNFTYLLLYNSDWGQTVEEYKIAIKNLYDSGTPIKVVAPYKTPYFQHYSLVPIEMQTFLSHNNVWSNADYVEVEYDLHETQSILARKRFIIANQPHVVKLAAAPLQNFVTDMAAPLKECKVYFSPVQEGTGDPSPENMRAITGWTNIGIMHKNGLPSEYQAVEYLQSTGTQFITGYFTPSEKGSIMLKIILEPDSMNDNRWYCGGRSNEHISMQVGIYNNAWYKDHASDIYEILSTTNGVEKVFCSKSYDNTSLPYDYLLFGRAWNGSTPDRCKIYQCTLYFNNIPIHDYIPCYRKTDNVAGMYDIVNNTFCINEGTGTFITGPDIQALPRPLLFENTYSFDWSSTFGTIYGGYVDLVTGEVWAEWKYIDFVTANWTQFSVGTSVITVSLFPGTISNRNNGFCNILPMVSNPNISGIEGVDWNNNRLNLCLSVSREITTLADFKAWLQTLKDGGITPCVIAKYGEPTLVTTLTPTQLKTLRGTNNIWSNSNGNIQVQFWKY